MNCGWQENNHDHLWSGFYCQVEITARLRQTFNTGRQNVKYAGLMLSHYNHSKYSVMNRQCYSYSSSTTLSINSGTKTSQTFLFYPIRLYVFGDWLLCSCPLTHSPLSRLMIHVQQIQRPISELILLAGPCGNNSQASYCQHYVMILYVLLITYAFSIKKHLLWYN